MNLFRAPEPLSSVHKLSDFDSGKPELDIFLSQLEMASQRDGFARTFVVSDSELNVLAYYAPCGGTIGRSDAPRQIASHGAPKEVPVVLLARLAVDTRFQGRGVGTMLMHHAFRSTLTAAENVAFRAMMVHALDEEALGRGLRLSRPGAGRLAGALSRRTGNAAAIWHGLGGAQRRGAAPCCGAAVFRAAGGEGDDGAGRSPAVPLAGGRGGEASRDTLGGGSVHSRL